MMPENSFVLASQVQKAPYSNSNKQVHLNVIHVAGKSPDRSSTSSPSKTPSSPSKAMTRRRGANAMAVSTGGGKTSSGAEPTKYDYLNLQNLRQN